MNKKALYEGLSFKTDLEKLSIDVLITNINAGTWKINNPYKHAEALQVIRRLNTQQKKEELLARDSREDRKISISERALSMSSEANLIAKKALAISESNSESAREQADSARRANTIATIAIIIAIISIAMHIYDIFTKIPPTQ